MGDPSVFGTELEHEGVGEARSQRVDEVREGEAVDGSDGGCMSCVKVLAGDVTDSSARSRVRRLNGSRDSFPGPTRSPSLQKQ